MGKGFGSVAMKIEWGSWPVVAPLYVTAVGMVLANGDQPGAVGRLGIILFLATMGLQLGMTVKRKAKELALKIDQSVGAVYEEGCRSERVRSDLEQDRPGLALVHRLTRPS